jgi:nitrate reductase gamma subunit
VCLVDGEGAEAASTAVLDCGGWAPVVLIIGSVALAHRRVERSEVAATYQGKVEHRQISP